MKKTLLFLAAALTFGLAANAQTAFSEDFDTCANGTVPTGWTTYEDALTNYSSYSSFPNTWTAYEQMMVCITWTEETTPVDRWLVTPQVAVPAASPMLLFDILGVNYGPGSPFAESLKVMVSTTDNQKDSFTLLQDLGELTEGNNTYAVNLSTYAGQNVYLAFACYTTDGMYIFLDNVIVKTVPANSIAAVSASAQAFTAQNGDCTVNLTVANDGSAALTAFDVTYTVNGGAEQTLNVTGVNVAPFTTYTHSFPVQLTTVGEATIAITVGNPNGEADVDASDNSVSATTTVYDPATTTQRTSLLEHFTTGQCQYCPAGHQRLDQAINGYEDRICWVAHHVGYGTDAMTINESNQIAALYGTNQTWAPAMTLDRNVEYAIEPEEGGVVGSVGQVNELASMFNNAINTPAFVTVNISDFTYDPQSRQLSVTVSGSFTSDYEGSPNLSLYLVEDSILGRQADAATQSYLNNYVNNHVIRATLSDIWGDADAFTATTAGSTYSKTFTYTLPTKMRANKCRLVAFVNNYGADMLHRTVANAAKSDFLLNGTDPTHVGITAVEASINIKTYPNPATEMAYISAESTIRSYEMVDAMGRTILSENNVNADMLELNVSGLAQGVYFVSVVTDKGVATERLTVVK